MSAPLPLSLLDSADHLGRCRYVELACFELLGRSAASPRHRDAATYLSGASLAHAWRGGLLEELLPVSAGLPDAAACTSSPGPALDGALALLEGAEDGAVLTAALTGALYPVMAAGYRERLARCAPAPDAALARALGRVLADLDAVASDWTRLLATLGRAAGVAGGSALALRLEVALGGAGGVFGPLGRAS